jgi:hypothetical protein
MEIELKHEKTGIDFAIYPVDGSRGAPMGRASGVWTKNEYGRLELVLHYNDLPFKLYLRQVPLYDGGYDKGGAYWGSPSNLWAAWALVYLPQVERELEVAFFVRASSRDEAERLVRLEFPNAKFYR